MNIEDNYTDVHQLTNEIDFLDMQINYYSKDIENLRHALEMAQEEIKRIQATPLTTGQLLEMHDDNFAIVQAGNGSPSYVKVLSTIDKELLRPPASVALNKNSSALVRVLPPDNEAAISIMREKPNVTYSDIGGLDSQKQEIRECVELPLTQGYLYHQIGIDPPRGCLLYGPPGCGKTLLARAVAHHTSATFISMVGSEFVQKYLGEGPRMVRDLFRTARENAPSIIFIDECDAICQKRFDSSTGGDREVQRILLEILTQLDGFDQSTDVKVIMATNRPDTLDPALVRPGRLDRKIEFPNPDRRTKRLIFQVCTSKMSLGPNIDLEKFVVRPDHLSGADISAICREAGMLAVRNHRYVVDNEDFEKAYESVMKKNETEYKFYQ